MNSKYLWIVDAIQMLDFLIVMPAIAIAIAYAAWRGKLKNRTPKQYGIICVVLGLISALLIVFAQWLNADVRTPQFYLQLFCLLVGFPLFGTAMGCFFSVLLGAWGWHKTTRLKE